MRRIRRFSSLLVIPPTTLLADELSMHLAIGTVLHRVFNFQQPRAIQRRNTAIILGVIVPFLIYHCMADEFVLHVILFGGMTVTVARKTRKIIATRIRDAAQRAKLLGLCTRSSLMALVAWALWNVDVHLCGGVSGLRRWVGLPWGVALELHGYWHILTAMAAYGFMAVIEVLLDEEEKAKGEGFAWPVGRVLEEIVTERRGKKSVDVAADGNGAAVGKEK